MKIYLRNRSTVYYINALVLALVGLVIVAARPEYQFVGFVASAASVWFVTMLFIRDTGLRLRMRNESILMRVANDIMLGQGMSIRDLACEKCHEQKASMCEACVTSLVADAVSLWRGQHEEDVHGDGPAPF